MKRTLIDLTEQIFGRLQLLKKGIPKQDGDYLRPTWECLCFCGTIKTVLEKCLKSGHTQSCGCLQRMKVAAQNQTHGLSRTSEYQTWCSMIGRCENPKHKAYPDYGGRGINICPEWRVSFETFLQDMGTKPTKRHTIERIDNEKGYSPDNCCWATRAKQNVNKRNLHYFTCNGITLYLTEWARRLNTKPSTILKRLYRGWSVQNALLTPIKSHVKPTPEINQVVDVNLRAVATPY